MRTVLLSVVLSLGLFACGDDDDGGGGGGGDTPDASTAIDAAPPVQASGPLSQVCNQNAPCPANSACLSQPGAANGVCSIPCTDINDTTTCPPAYTGPGLPICLLSVPGPNPGDPSQNFCAIVCQAPPEANCATCDGTCPTGMQCTAPQNGVAICEAI